MSTETATASEVVRVLAETSRCAWSLGDPKHPYGKDCLDDHPDKHPGVGYCWLLPTKQAEALAEAGLLRPQIAAQEPAGGAQGGSGDSRASGGLDGAPATDWSKVEHTADQCQFEECPSCGCCAHGKEHVIGCSTTLDRPLGTECPNTDCACKGGMG